MENSEREPERDFIGCLKVLLNKDRKTILLAEPEDFNLNGRLFVARRLNLNDPQNVQATDILADFVTPRLASTELSRTAFDITVDTTAYMFAIGFELGRIYQEKNLFAELEKEIQAENKGPNS